MNNTVPPLLFRALTWAGAAAFLAVAVIEWRLGSVYHAVLSLGIAVLYFFIPRPQRPSWAATLLGTLMLVFAIYRALTGYALLRGT
jgi:uncharacterized BrkB/YihY/UPF0761 family membrane protein